MHVAHWFTWPHKFLRHNSMQGHLLHFVFRGFITGESVVGNLIGSWEIHRRVNSH